MLMIMSSSSPPVPGKLNNCTFAHWPTECPSNDWLSARRRRWLQNEWFFLHLFMLLVDVQQSTAKSAAGFSSFTICISLSWIPHSGPETGRPPATTHGEAPMMDGLICYATVVIFNEQQLLQKRQTSVHPREDAQDAEKKVIKFLGLHSTPDELEFYDKYYNTNPNEAGWQDLYGFFFNRQKMCVISMMPLCTWQLRV